MPFTQLAKSEYETNDYNELLIYLKKLDKKDVVSQIAALDKLSTIAWSLRTSIEKYNINDATDRAQIDKCINSVTIGKQFFDCLMQFEDLIQSGKSSTSNENISHYYKLVRSLQSERLGIFQQQLIKLQKQIITHTLRSLESTDYKQDYKAQPSTSNMFRIPSDLINKKMKQDEKDEMTYDKRVTAFN